MAPSSPVPVPRQPCPTNNDAQTSIAELKRYNNVLTEATLASRDALFIPVRDPGLAAGKRCAFVHDAHSKRRFVVLLGEGEELPEALQAAPAARSEAAMRRLVGVLERALGVSTCEAKFYLAQGQGDVRAAIEACNQDRRWARVMKRRSGLPQRLLACLR